MQWPVTKQIHTATQIPILPFSPWLRINHLTWGSNESAQQ
jgi:hypothetical protein